MAVGGAGGDGAGEGATDEALVAALVAGDGAALARLYDRYALGLLGAALRLLGERREAEDLVHDVFLEAWHKARDFDPARGSVRAWLFLRLRSRALDLLRSPARARVDALEPAEARLGVAPAAEEAPDQTRVRVALAGLTAEQRRVLELGYYEGLSSSEIAARLGVPLGTVKSRVAAALARLRAVLGTAEEPRS